MLRLKKTFIVQSKSLWMFSTSWAEVFKLHMPQFSVFEVCVEHVCHFPWHSSSLWEPDLCRGRCNPKCHPRDHAVPGGPGMWCQRQVPGGHHLNNASCPALAQAGTPLWSVPETSVAWVFNHLACTSLRPINPSALLHSSASLSSSSLRRN